MYQNGIFIEHLMGMLLYHKPQQSMTMRMNQQKLSDTH